MLSVLDAHRIVALTSAVAMAVDPGRSYFDALNSIQGSLAIVPAEEFPRVVFELDVPTRAFLCRAMVGSGLSPLAIRPFPADCRPAACASLERGLELLMSYRPELPFIFRRLVGTLLVVNVENCESGSSSDCLGTVWLSPRPEWPSVRYAESVCHELVHQALFLEDMVCPLFQFEDEPLIVSSIRREPRLYSSSFHAAVVAGALIELYRSLDLPAEAERFVPGLSESLPELHNSSQHLSSRGRELLAELPGIIASPQPLAAPAEQRHAVS